MLGRPERKLGVEEVVRVQLSLDLAERVVIFRLVVVLRPVLGVVQVELALAARPGLHELPSASTILFTGPLPFADRQANLMGKNEKQTRKLMNDCYRRAHEKEDADETVDVD